MYETLTRFYPVVTESSLWIEALVLKDHSCPE